MAVYFLVILLSFGFCMISLPQRRFFHSVLRFPNFFFPKRLDSNPACRRWGFLLLSASTIAFVHLFILSAWFYLLIF